MMGILTLMTLIAGVKAKASIENKMRILGLLFPDKKVLASNLKTDMYYKFDQEIDDEFIGTLIKKGIIQHKDEDEYPQGCNEPVYKIGEEGYEIVTNLSPYWQKMDPVVRRLFAKKEYKYETIYKVEYKDGYYKREGSKNIQFDKAQKIYIKASRGVSSVRIDGYKDGYREQEWCKDWESKNEYDSISSISIHRANCIGRYEVTIKIRSEEQSVCPLGFNKEKCLPMAKISDIENAFGHFDIEVENEYTEKRKIRITVDQYGLDIRPAKFIENIMVPIQSIMDCLDMKDMEQYKSKTVGVNSKLDDESIVLNFKKDRNLQRLGTDRMMNHIIEYLEDES